MSRGRRPSAPFPCWAATPFFAPVAACSLSPNEQISDVSAAPSGEIVERLGPRCAGKHLAPLSVSEVPTRDSPGLTKNKRGVKRPYRGSFANPAPAHQPSTIVAKATGVARLSFQAGRDWFR